MGAGTFFLLLIIVVLAAAAIGVVWAIRTGLWARETSPKGDTVEGDERFDKRPEHTKVDEPGNQTYIGT